MDLETKRKYRDILNEVIQQLGKQSGASSLKKDGSYIFFNSDTPGSPFTGDIMCHAWYNIDEIEVVKQEDGDLRRRKLRALVKCRIEGAILSIIDLLQNDLELLRKLWDINE